MASGARPALPGGHDLGEQLYFTGSNKSFESGDKLVHGQQGEVVGPATGEHHGNGLQMLFPGNKGSINCYLYQFSVEKPPPLPGGHELGDQLYFTGSNQTFENGETLVHGQQGEVVGPATGVHQGNGLKVLFPGNKGSINCRLLRLSVEKPPPLPGGHELGEQLYFTGPNYSFENGDKLVHGQQGEVVGPATGEHHGNGLQMLFPGNKGSINCRLLRLSVEKPPPLPGGHEAGDQLYYTGPNKSFENGDKLTHGQQGEVVGPATEGTHQGNGLKMLFPGNKGHVDCSLTKLVREKPPPLPGGHDLGDQLYYTGSNQTFKSGDELVHGQQGEVVGPVTVGTHQGNGLQMLFPGNKGHVNCSLLTLSREQPPPLPGGHDLGEQLYFTGPNESFESGDKVVHGQQGEVVGPATGEHYGNGLKLRFPGNKGSINCYLYQFSVEKPPPLPGGHELGEQLYFTGPNYSFENGDKVVHGQQGEVVGPATGVHQGNGLKLLFPGNKGPINCRLLRLSVEKPPPLPGGHEAGDQLYYTGPNKSFKNGDKLTHGQQGEVVGPATEGTHQGNGLTMLFPGNKGSISCYLPRLSVEQPPPLPGGHDLGDQLYYTGSNKSFENGDKLVHGQSGEVVGPATDFHQGNGLKMRFPGNKSWVDCRLALLSHELSLPGGFRVGEELYFIGGGFVDEQGDKAVFGCRGSVTGPARNGDADAVSMSFSGNRGDVHCRAEELSREPAPSLPGGFILGEHLYFTGEDQIVGRGILVRGSRGEVVGLGLEPDSLAMRFSNKVLFSGNQPVNIASLSRDDPCAVSSVPENGSASTSGGGTEEEEEEEAERLSRVEEQRNRRSRGIGRLRRLHL
ncbi:hypothetical protein EMIHUDRAFT_218958 [Emiliania huxleyi CCMP1516]|uniref:Uncharacterized protein n=2 Tax=Emiliania huxleyi TaxID=2903 RepID=A0A0D3I5H3_EMIH1|nr:hypothetical protein EMIHUDRAFT_218958 [Emiliania huxleyi CCMP1516]EOD06508.1 hypothetical protein EMIHUDRAFT_218958 [Emiliania huxleyi CCMP1516]|eukprot:XP_005758937.1 hypothetical protein EMIHUDRAFT_218958 [Emiliania huxleyi CCMP1516]